MILLRKYLMLIVFLFLILTVISTPLLAQESYEIPLDKLKTPTELQDVIDTFSRLKYNFAAFKEGEKAQDFSVEFQYQGKEEIKGKQADKISIETSTMQTSQSSLMKFWLSEGEIVKMEHQGQEIPAEMASMMKEQWLQSVFFPFYHFEEFNLEELADVGKITRAKEMIGEKEVDIIEIEANNLLEYGLKSGNVKLAEFEKLMMMVSFDYITLKEVEEEYEEGRFEVEVIELR